MTVPRPATSRRPAACACGKWATETARSVDRAAPPVQTAPIRGRMRGPVQLGAAVIVLIAWLVPVASAGAATTPTVSIGDVSIVEGGSTTRVAYLPVTLSEPAASTVTVAYTVT